jgi:DNA-binding transcriptional regulator YiaG
MTGSSERWKPVLHFENDYEVSDHGKVRRSRDARGVKAGRFLKPMTSTSGYLVVVLYHDGRSKREAIHRLVAAAFIGPAPTPRHQVNHKNGIKSDNRLANLEWVTCQENNRHAVLTGLNTFDHPSPGERNGLAKLTWTQVAEIRALRGRVGARQIAKRYGVSRSAVQFIHQGKHWCPENEPKVSPGTLELPPSRGECGGARMPVPVRDRRDWLTDADAAEIRRACGFSQRTMRTALGIPRATFSRWERGQNAPSGAEGDAYCRVMAALARHLQIPEDSARVRPLAPDGQGSLFNDLEAA